MTKSSSPGAFPRGITTGALITLPVVLRCYTLYVSIMLITSLDHLVRCIENYRMACSILVMVSEIWIKVGVRWNYTQT